MNAKKKHSRVRIKNVLSAIAMMYIPVNDEHPFQAMTGPGVRRCQGDIVEQTEAHAPRRRGVMTRRPDQAQGGPVILLEHGINRMYTGAGSRQCHLKRFCATPPCRHRANHPPGRRVA